MTDIFSLSLKDLAPQSILHDPQILSLIQALDPQIKDLSRLSLEPLMLSRIDDLPEHVLDLLAQQFHADFYDLAATLSMKRSAVKNAVKWHMHKGTEWAILEALRQIDISAEFVPWWESGDKPYTFKLKAVVSGDFYRTQGRDKLISSIRRAVEESKSARSFMTGLETQISFSENIKLFHGSARILSGSRRILLPPPEQPPEGRIFYANFSHLSGHEVITPCRERLVAGKIYAANFLIRNIDSSYGIELNTMQELLRQFEKRISAYIDASEKRTLAVIQANHDETNAKLENIRELLLWNGAGDDEPTE